MPGFPDPPKAFNLNRALLIGLFLMIAAGAMLPGGIVSQFSKPRNLLPREKITDHLHIYSDLSSRDLDFYSIFFEEFTLYFKLKFFQFEQDKPLDMYLFGTQGKYEFYNNRAGGPRTPFGYYRGPEANLIVVSLESGLGTATHELVHHFIVKGFTRQPCPVWVAEGLAMFFEKFMGYIDDEGRLFISVGYFSNWRFPQAKAAVEKLTLDDLLNNRHIAAERSFMLFLYKKGYLQTFINLLREQDNDPLGLETLIQVYGKDKARIEQEWKEWVRAQPIDANVNLVERAFILDQKGWDAWQEENKGRLDWDEREDIFVVRPKE
ncbi:MAG: hypothetical protein Q8Q08_02040 [Candidatus Omnitrophota bacterium]|nr:hypothetical protein [Candidatus Omnitrophota bacterium]MDZ4241488.1 hypothetical protein [Candidatus Omnitrophota bacterium]